MWDIKYDKNNRLLQNDNFLNNQNYIFWNYEKWNVLDSISSFDIDRLFNLLLIVLLVVICFLIVMYSQLFLWEKIWFMVTLFLIHVAVFTFIYIRKSLTSNKAKKYLRSPKNWIFKVNPKSVILRIDMEWKSTLSKWYIESQIIKDYLLSENIYNKINIVKEKKEIYRRKYGKVKTEETDSGHKIIY